MPDEYSRPPSRSADEPQRKPRLARSTTRLALAAAVAAVAFLVLAWAVFGGAGEEAAPVADNTQRRAEMSDFEVMLASGEPFRLSAQAGKVVVLEFLAPGCPSCAAELKVLNRVVKRPEGREVVVLVLDIGGLPAETVAEYYQDQGGGEALLYAADDGQRVARQYKVRSLGETVVLDRAGREIYRDGQGTREEDLVAAVEGAS